MLKSQLQQGEESDQRRKPNDSKKIDLHKKAVGREADQASKDTDNNATIDKAQIEARKVSIQAQLDADKKKADAQADAAKAKVDAQNK